ncbi:MAG TPA: cellulose biosynthesis cyclic di-GMP-binding regulatory protein BcsB [Burkholderiaceae bacterium]|nr:cellulose biosynthesis cyclic di-GMP-binding regulatory protein BcsB [Burkholderiaceae bacterium]
MCPPLTAMIRLIQSFMLVAAMAPASAAPETSAPVSLPVTATATAAPAGTPHARMLTLSSLAFNQPSVHLRSTEGTADFDFGVRADEIATQAGLKLRYTFSPALIAGLSHLKVLLNGEIVAVLPFLKEHAGRMLEQEIAIDPRFITGYNKLRFEFVGHYTNECEDSLHSSLWADISGASELKMTLQQVPVRNELSLLPQPFFDAHDARRLTLPYVFGARPSAATLRAAGITSSWFGKLAAWRGARFPARLDVLPTGHAVVFATNTERPAFLMKADPYTGPAVSVMTNPADGISKLLLVTGRDGNDLRMAAISLVLGNAALSGTSVTVAPPREETPRHAYDAPNWVRTDRPVKFGELVQAPQQLQATGHVPDAIRLNLRMPPDLYVWRSRGVPVDLGFRYTPPVRAGESRLVVGINDEFVQGFNLRPSSQGGNLARLALPLLENGFVTERHMFNLPAYKLRTRNQLQHAFGFTYYKDGTCRDIQADNVRAMIDPDSTIDFSGFPHYARMPHLGYFATSGFPFTKFADLSQTTIVMPTVPGAPDIEAMLTLLGRMGEASGYPATRVTVTTSSNADALRDRDLLLIGTAANQPLLVKWGERLPAIIANQDRRISEPARSVNFLYDWFGFGTTPDTSIAAQALLRGAGPLGALLGFESPLSSNRSVVAITGVDAADFTQVLDILDNDAVARTMYGSAVFVRGDKAESILAGKTYTLGMLPFWLVIWYAALEHPALSVAMLLAALALAAWLMHRARQRRRKASGAHA